jgi:excisionase family DNA binding protein
VLVNGWLGVYKDEHGRWNILHGPTGYRVRSYSTRNEALQVRDRLMDSPIDWEFTDSEILASREIARILQQVEKQVESKYEARKSLGDVAKIRREEGLLRTEEMTTQIERDEELLKLDEVAEKLGVAKRTVYHYIDSGRLPSVKPGKERRVFRRDVDALRRELGDVGHEKPPAGAMNLVEVAQWLRYHPSNVRRHIREEGLPVHRAGNMRELYFKKDEVMAWMRERSQR